MPSQPRSDQPTPPVRPEENSLKEAAQEEAERHKWITSEKAGHDLGDRATREWYDQYWRSWCRERWYEHLRGERYWKELDRDDYGLLRKRFHYNHELALRIVSRITQGGENLDIIRWALDQGYDLQQVLEVLKILDINARRLDPHFVMDEDPVQPTERESPSWHPRALVVDDDEDTRELLSEVLREEGFEVTIAATGEEAIGLVRENRFQLFLIDLMLPGRHGAQVSWWLRRHGVVAPVIAISAALDNWNRDDLYDCGFTGMMSKPFDLQKLRSIAADVYVDAT